MNYPHIAARALNRPLLLEPGYARHFFAALGNRLNFGALVDAEGNATQADGLKTLAAAYGRGARGDSLYFVRDGVAVIPVEGTLVHKSGYVGSQSGTMGYDGLHTQLSAAMNDPEVKAVLLDVDSPGGEVAGCQEMGRIIAASSKPVWAHANEQAASAAYWLASQCDKVFLTETASVGSIGVLVAHADASEKLAKDGYQVTLIYSGAHKVDGNPYGPLPDDVRSEIQADIDSLREAFAATVAQGRGIPVSSVLDTEARVYRGQAAVNAGLADGVASFDETLSALIASVNGASSIARSGKKGITMSQDMHEPSEQGGNTISAEAHNTAVEAARKDGAKAERARISAILNHENAAGREATAKEFALSTEMSADDAIRVLASVPAITNKASAALSQMADVQAVAPDAPAKGNTLDDRVSAFINTLSAK